jgi:hypothetical protein
MAVLFALGVMSLVWMAVIAAVVFVEKVFVFGSRLRWVVAVGLIGAGSGSRSRPEASQRSSSPAAHRRCRCAESDGYGT